MSLKATWTKDSVIQDFSDIGVGDIVDNFEIVNCLLAVGACVSQLQESLLLCAFFREHQRNGR